MERVKVMGRAEREVAKEGEEMAKVGKALRVEY